MTLDSRRRIALFLYTFHFKSHCKIHRIRGTAYPAVLPSHTKSAKAFEDSMLSKQLNRSTLEAKILQNWKILGTKLDDSWPEYSYKQYSYKKSEYGLASGRFSLKFKTQPLLAAQKIRLQRKSIH